MERLRPSGESFGTTSENDGSYNKKTLTIMDVQDLAGEEEEVLETAIQLRITFYDASYVYFAREKELKLITEDLRLIKRITAKMKVSTLDSVI